MIAIPEKECPWCDGHLEIYSSKRRGAFQVQYLRCYACGRRPAANKIVRPAHSIRRRRQRLVDQV